MEINKLINLQRLVLAENIIERLPVNLGKLQSLKMMNLDGNRITSLPDELDQLVRLERLSVSRNLLESLPLTIGSLRNLVLLNVSNNKLQSLPESVGSCFSLEELQANDNLIEELPSSVCNLSQLKSLCLDNNKMKQICEAHPLSCSTQVQECSNKCRQSNKLIMCTALTRCTERPESPWLGETTRVTG
ncbi:unnamed protein product [Sphenostylis stenocarpa]|uniref:Uncharacterized protein n=1 Tax=Sphenostylis stenocarpa TaxID=92480 RepID=A0AA86VR68_9FABA|nr:unnamed protein product [Sphenostylis stenocarpa]